MIVKTELDAVVPLYDPTIVTEVGTVTVFVGRLKLCDIEPPAITTFAAGNAAAVPLSATDAPPPGAGPDSVIVTLTLFPPMIDDGDTDTETRASGTRFTVAFWDEPPSVAVTVTLRAERIVPAVTLKLAVLTPAATVAEDGVDSRVLLSDSWTAVALDGAELSVTVHVLEAPDPRLPGVQESPATVGEDVGPVIVPPVPDMPMNQPAGAAPRTFVTPMAVEVTPDAIVRLRLATTPLEIFELFMPVKRQVVVPVPGRQFKDLPATVALAPTATEMDVMLADEYVNVHCSAAGSFPTGELRLRFTVAAPLEAAVAELSVKVSVCA